MNFINDQNIQEIQPLITPELLLHQLPISSKALDNVLLSREIIKNILDKKDSRLLIIIGPCSIHNIQEALDYAKHLQEIQKEVNNSLFIVMRTYFEKPRTTIGWKGFINDPDLNDTNNINKGLHLARKLLIDINEMGIPTSLEILDTFSYKYLSDLISWGAIGARTSESQIHREIVSSLTIPIGFKNSTNGNIKVIIDSIKTSQKQHTFIGHNLQGNSAIIKSNGNNYVHAILRGSQNSPNYHYSFIESVSNMLLTNNLYNNIMIDCSHGNSNKKFKNQIKVIEYLIQLIENGYGNIMGLMIESNIHNGNQELSNNLKYGVSITDECIDWKMTEILLKKLNNSVQHSNYKKFNTILYDDNLLNTI